MSEKGPTTAEDAGASSPSHSVNEGIAPLVRPTGWMYKSRKIGKLSIPWYASPQVQLVLVAFVCFLCPGMFNAVNGLGGGGNWNTKAVDGSNTALYSTFAVVGFFSGTITNKLGIRIALSCGGIGYVIYIASYLCYSHTENYGFTVFAGALLGVCAGILWCAQGAIMMSYPPEGSKGRYISVFWMIFNLGGVIGSLVRSSCRASQSLLSDISRSHLVRTSMLLPTAQCPMGLTSASLFSPPLVQGLRGL